MTSPHSSLPVPDASLDAFRRLCSQVEPEWTMEQRVQQVAGPVVAAVLRDGASKCNCHDDYALLRDIADEIERG